MYRCVRVRYVPLILLVLLGTSRPAFSQEPTPLSDQSIASLLPAAEQTASAGLILRTQRPAPRMARPTALVPLYVSFASLQALDAYTTTRALDRGAVEANPLMRGIVGSPVGMLAVKAGGTAGLVWASERMWKRNKTAAIVFLLAANSAMTWVVQHNYRAVR
jgi:hypothetical protein